jgi:hypothetical protein
MKTYLRFTTAAIALLLAAAPLRAAVPSVINYQGRLTDNSPQQNPIDATVTVDFSIWDSASGGSSLWSETQSVQVVKGLFNTLLGSTTPLPGSVFTGGATRYLEIHVSGETLAPRQRIAATPFAQVADEASKLGGLAASSYQQRIATPCPAGFAVNAVAADGTTTCIQGPQGPPGAGLDTGAISGTVTSCGGAATGLLVYVPGRSAVSYAATDGTFLLSYLPAGSYTVQIGPPSATAATLSDVVVTSGNTTATGTTNAQNLAVDLNNCGSCGAACSSTNIARVCAGGSCESGTCNAGFTDCNANKRLDGCETDTATSVSSCGSCGAACSTSNIQATCTAGVCTGTCVSGFTDCNNNRRSDGCEVSTATDANNCGSCGAVCSSNHVPAPACSGGGCVGACANGFGDCNANRRTDGCEVSLANDVNNCGACGLSCSTSNITRVCSSSSCQAGVCNAGFADCNNNKQLDGCEVNTNTSAGNCGTCGHVCGGATPNCSAGTCVP